VAHEFVYKELVMPICMEVEFNGENLLILSQERNLLIERNAYAYHMRGKFSISY
jgi:hypothetical protein